MAELRYVVVDVFTDRPLAGNQLAVFPDAEGIADELMQRLAREVNFSETVFVVPARSGGDARMRIFTPTIEVPFAGHPTLGTAFVLGQAQGAAEVVLETGSGPVAVALERGRDGAVVFGRMSQPIPVVEPFAGEDDLLAALRVERSEMPVEVYDNGIRHVFVRLRSREDVAALEPDMTRLAHVRGLLAVSCFAGEGARWKTRMFAPAGGVPEDPATGSAAGPLAAHLVRHGVIAVGQEIEISQGAEIGRPSTLHARVEGSPDRIERVEVGGAARIVGRGEFAL